MAKILIFSYYDNKSKDRYSFKEIGQLTLKSKEDYSKIHGYDFINSEIIDYYRSIGWYKIDFIREKLKENQWDYIFYCEADCLITNFTKRIEDIIDDKYDIIIAKNSVSEGWNGLNCGNLIIKNSEWSKSFLELWNNKIDFYYHDQAEQGALIDEFNRNSKNIEHRFKILSPRIFGGFRHLWYPTDNWKPGDWLLHLAGTHNSYRFEVFNFLKDKIINIPDYKIPFEPFV